MSHFETRATRRNTTAPTGKWGKIGKRGGFCPFVITCKTRGFDPTRSQKGVFRHNPGFQSSAYKTDIWQKRLHTWNPVHRLIRCYLIYQRSQEQPHKLPTGVTWIPGLKVTPLSCSRSGIIVTCPRTRRNPGIQEHPHNRDQTGGSLTSHRAHRPYS